MIAQEIRAFDVTTDDGMLRHGFVLEAVTSGDKKWMGVTLNSNNATGMGVLGWYETPNMAIRAIMESEEQRLVDR